MKTKVSIIGYYKSGGAVSGGQGVKTAILTDEIENAFGKENIRRIDTDNWRKHALSLLCNCFIAVRSSKNVLFLTDENGIKVFPKLLKVFNALGSCRLHYYVVGGWLTDYLSSHPSEIKGLMKLDAIYVEIPSMKDKLDEMGFTNIVLVNKFRRLNPVNKSENTYCFQEPYRLCYFSRVMKEKGIEDAVEAVREANAQAGREKFSLDIFGAVDEPYKERFDEINKSLPKFIKYCGIIDFYRSTETLKNYFAMLFPTYYKSEGYPNTVVDSYAAGLPIIATKWNYNAEIIREKEDGLLFEVENINQFVEAMNWLTDNGDRYQQMRDNCLRRCNEYQPANAIKKVIQHMK